MPVNQPLARAAINGQVVPGVVSLEVENLGYFAADRFRIYFAADAPGASYFAGLGTADITIDVALDGSGYGNLITGQVDHIQVDMLQNIALLSGRDLSAKLIDGEISETFANQTASQIAASIAARHQLTANITATNTPVGQYYELDHARNALAINAQATTEWSLLTWLAEEENFALSVSGTVLNFGPPPQAAAMFLVPENMMALSFEIATTIPAQTTVKSWNSRNKMAVTKVQGVATGLNTTLVRPNLTQAQANELATTHLELLGRQAVILTAKMPGDLTLAAGSPILLAGTNSIFDQSYMVLAVNRSLHARRGFTQTIRAYAAAVEIMDQFWNAVKATAGGLDSMAGVARFGLVSSFDPSAYAARVLIQPENVLSGWLPIISSWVGAGWGLAAPLTPGDQVLVIAQESDAEHGVIIGCVWSAVDKPPGTPSGELWLQHASGSFVKLLNDGTITLQAATLNVTGDLVVSGEISDQSGAHGTLGALRNAHDTHTHADPAGRRDWPAFGGGVMADLALQFGGDLSVDSTGDIALADGSALSDQRVLRRLLTNSGDYIWQRDYGAGLGQFVGQPGAPAAIAAVARTQMLKETAVASSPAPVIGAQASNTGIITLTLRYTDAASGQTSLLSFSI